ncbi:MAG: fimbrillin family protein [Prevotellaceae bacterium]|jgi:hypothetical protein|nr:fimbrillin family protein [Prevotellaceae bacterium]
MNQKSSFDLKTGVLGATSGTPAAITPYTATNGVKYEAIVLPAAVANTGDVSVEFTIGTDVFVWKVPAGTNFVVGSEYSYTITITRTGISVTGSINAWTTAPGGTGTAE